MLDGKSAAVFSSNRDHLTKDRLSLVHLGLSMVRVFSSWKEASEQLKNYIFDIAVVDSRLHDIDGNFCIKNLRNGLTYTSIPIVMVTPENEKDQILNAISAGCGGYVIRPYSLNTLEKHLIAAIKSFSLNEKSDAYNKAKDLVTQGKFDEAIGEFDELVQEIDLGEKHFQEGLLHLSKNQFGQAIVSFNKAISYNKLFAEAYKGMADAYKGKGDSEKYKEFLTKAADIYALQDKLDKVKELFIYILKEDPNAINPFNKLGVKLRKEGDYPGALNAYTQALKVTPDDANLLYNIAKAQIFAGLKEQSIESLTKAISLDQNFGHAKDLLKQITSGKKLKLSKK